ncbi:NAD(P)H-binding protein [Candidatus Marithrix sp. Canyon 246]|uniref:NAD(P)H-binding protein n=1 Tax=Candidatus Marithrix sp. Canyon 246 TaxID=1827136 RepID=UPI000849FC9A|nr:NAD(P)H-binding protein [Candidatus Marithrix sp. Canyon 246]
MNILLTGASGFVGQNLLSALVSDGHKVVACVRDTKKWQARFPEIECLACDFTKDHSPDVWVPRLKNIDLVINAVGIIVETRSQSFENIHTKAPVALFTAAKQVGINKILQISALGADDNAETPYHITKRAADDALKSLKLNSVIFYPSMVIGRGGDSTTLFSAMASLPIMPIIGKGDQQLQPIHIDHLKANLLELLKNWPTEAKSFELVGAKPISLLNLFALLRKWLQMKPTLAFFIPIILMKFSAALNDRLNFGPLTTDNLKMLLAGNCGNPTPISEVTGIKPKSIEESLQQTPVTSADIWHARLIFLQPLLRISIALAWIVVALHLLLIITYTEIMMWIMPVLWLEFFSPIYLLLIVATLIMLVLKDK